MKLLQKSLLGLVIACMIIAFGSVLPADFVSAGSDEVQNISLPYTQVYDADSTRTDDTFKYRIVPVNGAPAPEKSMNGVYYFNVKAKPKSQKVSGNIDLSISFEKPGEYKYEISSYEPKKIDGMKYDESVYTAHIYVKNAESDGFITEVVLTAKGSKGKKAALSFNPSFSAKTVAQKERTTSSPDGNGTVRNVNHPSDGNVAQPTQQPNQPSQAVQTDQNDQSADEPAAEEKPTALEKIRDTVLPKADPNRHYWSLINLIFAILTALMGIILFARYMQRIDTEADEYIIRREGKWRLLGIVPAVVSVAVLLSTENFGDKMGLTDEWTPFMSIALLAEIGICVFVYKMYDGKKDKQMKSVSA